MSVAYIGRTKLTDEDIAARGTPMMKFWYTDLLASDFIQKFPKYHGLKANCQNFALHLLQDIWVDVEDYPETISLTVKHTMSTFDRSSRRRNAYGTLDGPSVAIM